MATSGAGHVPTKGRLLSGLWQAVKGLLWEGEPPAVTLEYVTILLRRGLRSALENVSNTGHQEEPAYTTDTEQFFIHNGTMWKPIPSLDMALVFEGEILTHNDEVLWVF